MRWSKLKGQQWGGVTLPARHDGHFFNTEIKVRLLPRVGQGRLRHEEFMERVLVQTPVRAL